MPISEKPKRGPKPDPDHGVRVRLPGCYVNRVTAKRLKAVRDSGVSQGRAIDQSVAAAFAHVCTDS